MQCMADERYGLGADDSAVAGGKLQAELIEPLLAHAPEEPGKDMLLGFAVGIEVQFHEHQHQAMTQEPQQEAARAAGKLYERQQGVASGQGSVEIEYFYFSHS